MTQRPWAEQAPATLNAVAADWELEVGDPFPGASASLTVPAILRDGTDAVLKVAFPHRESEQEADALFAWDGNGAVRLLAVDRDRFALLLERCRPGLPLAVLEPEEALDVLVDLLPRLWLPAGEPFRPLADEAAWWASYLEERWEALDRPFERSLLDLAAAALRDLSPTQGDAVLLHQDLHGGNVLSAEREPWLVIDPKPLAGEREFAAAPIVRSSELGHSRRAARYRLDRVTGDLGLDRERARLWTIGQTIAWCFDGTCLGTHIETARWLL